MPLESMRNRSFGSFRTGYGRTSRRDRIARSDRQSNVSSRETKRTAMSFGGGGWIDMFVADGPMAGQSFFRTAELLFNLRDRQIERRQDGRRFGVADAVRSMFRGDFDFNRRIVELLQINNHLDRVDAIEQTTQFLHFLFNQRLIARLHFSMADGDADLHR